MGILDRLDALDRKVLRIDTTDRRRTWRQNLRWWWAVLAVSFFVAVVGAWSPGASIVAVFPAFVAGYFYNERLRELGRESRLRGLRRPPGA